MRRIFLFLIVSGLIYVGDSNTLFASNSTYSDPYMAYQYRDTSTSVSTDGTFKFTGATVWAKAATADYSSSRSCFTARCWAKITSTSYGANWPAHWHSVKEN